MTDYYREWVLDAQTRIVAVYIRDIHPLTNNFGDLEIVKAGSRRLDGMNQSRSGFAAQ